MASIGIPITDLISASVTFMSTSACLSRTSLQDAATFAALSHRVPSMSNISDSTFIFYLSYILFKYMVNTLFDDGHNVLIGQGIYYILALSSAFYQFGLLQHPELV